MFALPIAWSRLNKHVSVATDMRATIKDIVRNSVFYKRSVLRLYNQARQAVDGQ
jgi:hypothetical protein